MNSENEQLQTLLDRTRQFFIGELHSKLERLSKYVENTVPISIEETQEILRTFHSIYGTASTLGLGHLAVLGQKGEIQVKDFLALDRTTEPQFLVLISHTLKELQHQLTLLEHSVSASDLTTSPAYTSLPEAEKILLIDDDISLLKLMQTAFTREGYKVYICDDSISAMDIIAIARPDVILLDIMMPKIDGYEILAKIKNNPKFSDICIIFVSALDDIEAKVKGMGSGIDDYITKPFNLLEVLSRVEMVLRRAHKFKEKLLKDSLTGAYTRSYLNERLTDELDRYKRNQTLFSIAFVDLDFFKLINDTYGHQTGDFVLKQFVEFMNMNLREYDVLFRYGGEEFVILLPDTTEQQATLALERLRETFAQTLINYAGNTFLMTFSCGIKEVGEKDTSMNHLLNFADEAMYAAKREGRNRVIPYSSLQNEAQNKKTVLIVDDENTILKLLGNHLLEIGYNVFIATNGQHALELLASNAVDAVILDLGLPDIDGLEICRKIRENQFTRSLKIIILSKRSSKGDIVDGFDCGADDYVTKPFSMDELEARILRVLKH